MSNGEEDPEYHRALNLVEAAGIDPATLYKVGGEDPFSLKRRERMVQVLREEKEHKDKFKCRPKTSTRMFALKSMQDLVFFCRQSPRRGEMLKIAYQRSSPLILELFQLNFLRLRDDLCLQQQRQPIAYCERHDRPLLIDESSSWISEIRRRLPFRSGRSDQTMFLLCENKRSELFQYIRTCFRRWPRRPLGLFVAMIDSREFVLNSRIPERMIRPERFRTLSDTHRFPLYLGHHPLVRCGQDDAGLFILYQPALVVLRTNLISTTDRSEFYRGAARPWSALTRYAAGDLVWFHDVVYQARGIVERSPDDFPNSWTLVHRNLPMLTPLSSPFLEQQRVFECVYSGASLYPLILPADHHSFFLGQPELFDVLSLPSIYPDLGFYCVTV